MSNPYLEICPAPWLPLWNGSRTQQSIRLHAQIGESDGTRALTFIRSVGDKRGEAFVHLTAGLAIWIGSLKPLNVQ
jgi:hypothetical protein